jgi:hypothetical protein
MMAQEAVQQVGRILKLYHKSKVALSALRRLILTLDKMRADPNKTTAQTVETCMRSLVQCLKPSFGDALHGQAVHLAFPERLDSTNAQKWTIELVQGVAEAGHRLVEQWADLGVRFGKISVEHDLLERSKVSLQAYLAVSSQGAI